MANIHSNMPPKPPTNLPHSVAEILQQHAIDTVCLHLQIALNKLETAASHATTIPDPDGYTAQRAIEHIALKVHTVITLLEE